MALHLALKTFAAGDAARALGVTTGLLRQWKKHGVLDLGQDSPQSDRNAITLCFMEAARVLIDAGAGYRESATLVNELGAALVRHVLDAPGALEILSPLSEEEARAFVYQHEAVSLFSVLSAPYFAFRNDAPSIGHPQRAARVSDIQALERWLTTGEADPLSDKPLFASDGSEEGFNETDEDTDLDGWEPAPPPPPLPPSHAATILHLPSIAADLVRRTGPVAEVYDTTRLEVPEGHRAYGAWTRLQKAKAEVAEATRRSVQILSSIKESQSSEEWAVTAARLRDEGFDDYLTPEGEIVAPEGA